MKPHPIYENDVPLFVGCKVVSNRRLSAYNGPEVPAGTEGVIVKIPLYPRPVGHKIGPRRWKMIYNVKFGEVLLGGVSPNYIEQVKP